jgi:addiction module RelB/DinJ family antitoxin
MAQVNIRIDDELKKEAEEVLDEIGMPLTTAVTVFLKKVVRERRIPFELNAGREEQGIHFRSIIINRTARTFTILDGTKGTYSFDDIQKMKVMNEEAGFRGKDEPFLHQMLGGASAFVGIEPQTYVGIKIITKTHDVLGVYVSKKPVNMGSDAYKKDHQEAEKIASLLD